MPTKTDRILSYLPGTFRASPRPTALYSVVDAFGSELLKAENSLAALMLTHWVDHADRGADFISDLACFAALYGLSPQGADQSGTASATSTDGPPCPPLLFTDEGVEEFREHLKRYVRTFIEGTVTVQGILRITAEALGLHIADDYTQLDTWWKRTSPELITTEPRGEDAAALLFGSVTATATGTPTQAARIVGTADLSNGVDLRGASILRIKLDGAAAVDVDCTEDGLASAMQLDDIVKTINMQLGPTSIATGDGRFLTLTSPIVGADSQLAIEEVAGDAAPLLLGLLPFTYHGSEAISASVASPFDLHNGVDLGENHYLRLQVDRDHLAEVDLPSIATTLDEIVHAINNALGGINVAAHDGHFLTLTSPNTGINSSITLLTAAAQDAKEMLFGSVNAFTGGVDARAAIVIGSKDLSKGVDLSTHDRVRIQVNNQPPMTIDCTGNDPAKTLPAEIVAIVNARLGPGTASSDGRFIRLVSPTSGPASTIAFEPLSDEEDATEIIFGIVPRTFRGAVATNAHLLGKLDLSAGVDLRAVHVVHVTVDNGTPVEVDVRSNVQGQPGTWSKVLLNDLVEALQAALGPNIASHDGQHLILASPTLGGASRIDLGPLVKTNRRRFVTRAFITDEAAYALFGFLDRSAQGAAATQARVSGTVDLSRGVDVSTRRFLRIAIDGQTAVEVDFAKNSSRPRVATLDEVKNAINDALSPAPAIASSDGLHLVLASPLSGSTSAIRFEPSRGADALDILLGKAPAIFRGQDATRVSFESTVDGSAGIDLSTANSIKIGIDGAAAKEINCAGFTPAKTALQEIVIAINVAFSESGSAVASQDGTHIFLTSPTIGPGSIIEFAVPTQPDATKAIFGIIPRIYHGTAATSALVVGSDLSAATDLSIAHFLNIAVDGNAPVTVDCATGVAKASSAQIQEIVTAIAQQLKNGTVTRNGSHLTFSSARTGASASLQLLPYTGGDAHDTLLGATVPWNTVGDDPTPATITGANNLLTPVNLDGQRTLRLAIDGGYPLDIDVAGATPAQTTLDEIVTTLNTVLPGLASATDTDQLRLSSPTLGENSQLELYPLRTLELIEYPSAQRDETPRRVTYGVPWFETNDSGVDADLAIELSTPQGASCPSLVNLTSGTRLRLMISLRSDELVQVSRDPITGVRATITTADGVSSPIAGTKILVGPPGAQMWVPFPGEWQLRGGEGGKPATLQLNNPLAPALVVLLARQGNQVGSSVTVSVTPASTGVPVIADGESVRLTGWVRTDATGYRFVATADPAGNTVARLLPGRDVSLAMFLDHVVLVTGSLHAGDTTPLLLVKRIADVFDVTIKGESEEGKPVAESYPGVTIGTGTGVEFPESLTWQITTRLSQLVRANEVDKGSALVLPQGRSEWVYLDGDGSRFDAATFGDKQGGRAYTAAVGTGQQTQPSASFAGCCQERAMFNISRFSDAASEQGATVFAKTRTVADPPVVLQFHWMRPQPGAFVVNIPDTLPERFGSRFNQARFGMANNTPEEFKDVITESVANKEVNKDYIVTRLATSHLVVATPAPIVPIGWDPMIIPFYHPRIRMLTGGTDTQSAALYLKEDGVPGFICLKANKVGTWGNAIAVTARKGSKGPAYYDITISYPGVRLENARQTVRGGAQHQALQGEQQLPTSGDALLNPGPIGILQAKAAGVQAGVTRQRA